MPCLINRPSSILFILFYAAVAFSGTPTLTTFQTRILKPTGVPLEAPSVDFRFTILDSTGTCVLYVEDYTSLDMSSSMGIAAFSLGSGSKQYPAGGTALYEVFNNGAPSFPCQGGGSFMPGPTDRREIVMQFNDGSGWQTLPQLAINSVFYANYANRAEALGAYTANDYLRPATLPSCTGTQALTWDGTSFTCMTPSGGGGGSVSSVSGTAPISVASGSSTPVISIAKASAAASGYLSSADWTTFNGKANSVVGAGKLYLGNASGDATGVTLSGDATLATSGVMTLANSGVTAGTYGSTSTIPFLTIDSKGRVTSASSGAYQDATASAKGIVQVGSNIHVTSGTISITSSDVTSALGFTPASSAAAGFANGGNPFSADATLGATSNFGLGFLTNNATRMTITNGGNVGIGTSSPQAKLDVNGAIDVQGMNGIRYPSSDSTLGQSIAIGAQALQYQDSLASTAFLNTAVGYQSMSSATMTTSAVSNTALGSYALSDVTTGKNNVVIGASAAYNMTDGGYNTIVGAQALQNSSGNNNTALGYGSGSQIYSNYSYATYVGYNSGNFMNGNGNTGVGSFALNGNGSTSVSVNNTALGFQAGYDITTGAHNIFIGDYATTGVGITSGSNNIMVGQDVRPPSRTASNQLNMGNLIYATGLGSGTTSASGNVGIGTTSPGSKLEVVGDINITGNFKINGVNMGGGSGSVTNVSSANGDIAVVTGSTTPVLTLNSGTGTNQIVKLTAAGKYPAVDGSLITNLNLASGTGTLPIANGGTNSSTTLNNNRIMVSSGGAIVEAPAMTNGQIMIGYTGQAPVASTLAAGSGMLVTNGTGTVSLTVDSGMGANKIPVIGGVAAAANSLLMVNGTGTALIGETCSLNQILLWNGTTWTCVTQWSTSSSDISFSGGKVGIGTTTPSARLEIASGTANVSGLKFSNFNSSTPTSTAQAVGVDASGNLVTISSGAGGSALSSVTAATAGNTLANGANTQNWNWKLTSNTAGMSFGETTASTGGTGTQSIVNISNLASSTAVPLTVIANGNQAQALTVTNNNGGYGIYATSLYLPAVQGIATASPGIYGATSSVASSDAGLAGMAYNYGIGVYGQSVGGISGLFQAYGSTNTSPTLVTMQSGSSTADLFQAQNSSGTSLVNITSAGKVGIGTTSPTAALTVYQGAIVAIPPTTGSTQCINFAQGNMQVSSYSGTNTLQIGGLVDGGAYTVVLTGYTAGQNVTVNAFTNTACSAGVTYGVDFGGSSSALTSTFVASGNVQLLTFIYSAARGVVYATASTNFYR